MSDSNSSARVGYHEVKRIEMNYGVISSAITEAQKCQYEFAAMSLIWHCGKHGKDA